MARLVILAGVSGAGKSRYAEERDIGTYVVSSDAIRAELGDINDQSRNALVFSLAHSRIGSYLSFGLSVIFDATNLNAEHLEKLIQEIRNDNRRDGVGISVLVIHCSTAIAKQRIAADLAAGKVRAAVPDAIVDRQYAQLQALLPKLEEFRSKYGIELEEVVSK